MVKKLNQLIFFVVVAPLLFFNSTAFSQSIHSFEEALIIQDQHRYGRDHTEHYKQTFISEIDGSVQYYAVAPQKGGKTDSPALFLSVHGAGVEAIGQARAYEPKDWGTLVAPTNRRPRGFNWEDWGWLDAMEVLDLSIRKYSPDPSLIVSVR